jgi:hypothetical protein
MKVIRMSAENENWLRKKDRKRKKKREALSADQKIEDLSRELDAVGCVPKKD